MSRASAIAVAPVSSTARDEVNDNDLVGRVRRGDDRAFEALFERYRGPVTGYVMGMVKDHARAEDVTQEVFISALRRMRATERPIAFKPWIYEIAKNACIDQYRRSKRGEEVSYDVDGGLCPSDQRRLVAVDSAPDERAHAREQLRDLCGAFGDLSESHHKILVLRELEGRSYREIGEELGMSRPAVESTLFRARRRLTEEYSELVSGRRCERVQAVITATAGGRLGTRDHRRMARHLSYCQPCRRHARVMGVEVDVTAERSKLARASAWLFPVPAFLRGRRGGASDDSLVSQWSVSLGAHAEPLGSGLAKAAAAAATLAVATFGSGVVSSQSSSAGGKAEVSPAPLSQRMTKTTPRTTSTPAASRRDDRRLPVQIGSGTTVILPTYPGATVGTPPTAGSDPAQAPAGERKPARDGAGAPAGTPGAPNSDDVVRGVNDTATTGSPKKVEVPAIETPAFSTPNVTAAPSEPPAAPQAPSAPAAPSVSVPEVEQTVSRAGGLDLRGAQASVDAAGVAITTGE
jgi:RNA polymerase sigma factor (sigma-70 family)